MKKLKVAIVIVIVAALACSVVVFAQQDTPGNSKTDAVKSNNVAKDPILALQDLKAKIEQKLADGKIAKNKADAITAKIDAKIKELQDFNSLTPQQKKEKLVNDFTAAINKKVQDGKLTQDKADTIINNFKSKVDKWDGNGYPPHYIKGFKGFEKNIRGHFGKGMKDRMKEILDKAVKDGKITDKQEQDILGYVK